MHWCSSADLSLLQQYLVTLRREAAAHAAQARVAIFDVFDGCAASPQRSAASAAIVEFVRRELPASSRIGYSEAGPEQLNRRRTGPSEFKPYLQ
jgi:hypothetical protein